MDDVEILPSTTLLGLLQRGRGDGARLAATAGEEGAAAVLACVCGDPRVDSQVEDRSLYYARLVADLGVSLDAIEAHLFDPADSTDTDEYRTGLALEVLADAHRLGVAGAGPLLRRYLTTGWNWEWALDHILDLDDAALASGLGSTVLRRIENDTTSLRWRSRSPLWDLWEMAEPGIASALERERSRVTASAARRPPSPVGVTALLAQCTERNNFVTARKLAISYRPEDRDELIAAAMSDEPGPKAAALRALGKLDDPAIIEPATAVLVDQNASEPLRTAARVALAQGRSREALTWARRWADADGEVRSAAAEVIAAVGGPEDLETFVAALHRNLALDCVSYELCHLVENARRFPDGRVVDVLRQCYDETTYSYLRMRAASALVAVDAGFAKDRAVESLWDCEAATRRTGALHASLSVPEVAARLAVLSDQPFEEDATRTAAGERLAT